MPTVEGATDWTRCQAIDVIILPHVMQRALNELSANQSSAGGYGWTSTPVLFQHPILPFK
jgi:hypothetical protein